MSINRRKFVRSSLLAGAGIILPSVGISGRDKQIGFAGINPFILLNPGAVFIMNTEVERKTDSAAIKKAGLDFGRSVFGFTDDAHSGIPLTHKVVIKPNLTCRARGNIKYTVERSMGIVTDVFFVEGIIESLKELGFSSGQFYVREVNCPGDLEDGGYPDMAERTGIDLQGIDIPAAELSPDKIQWIDVPDGVFFRRIPYLWPVNAPDTFLLNIAKFKTHGMGLTLCAKNLQGTIAMNYQAHCSRYGAVLTGVNPGDINPAANTDILNNYHRHKAAGIPRWDKPGENGGIWQETWATRCLDNNSVTLAGLHIIEGIYGRDGNFMDGPGENGLATDYMTNYIIFGRNQFHADIIGHYLAGHEPGNFGLFHMARERGMAETIDPAKIPLFKWHPESGAEPVELNQLERFPLKTYYLQRNYSGYNEPYWHLVNEPFDYSQAGKPDSIILQQNFPNPVRHSTTINFQIPAAGHVSGQLLNEYGSVVKILFDRNLNSGCHSITWDTYGFASGMYLFRLRYEGIVRTSKILVIR